MADDVFTVAVYDVRSIVPLSPRGEMQMDRVEIPILGLRRYDFTALVALDSFNFHIFAEPGHCSELPPRWSVWAFVVDWEVELQATASPGGSL
jgi:hypothetical protein